MRPPSLDRLDLVRNWFRALAEEIYDVSGTLLKIMVPTLLLVKLLEEIGGIELIGLVLGPAMEIVGLPESMGLVWATTALTSIYAGMVVFFDQGGTQQLSVAQVTVLGSMMLIAHALPVEVRIAQKAGVRVLVSLSTRILGAFVLGMLLHHLYAHGEWLQEPARLLWAPEETEQTLADWTLVQLESLATVLIIVACLMTGLKLLRTIGVERLLIKMLQPGLKLIGIGQSASTITMIGLSLGLTFGGGLLIREAKAGHVPTSDVFKSMTLLGLCHSVIEDSLLILMIGADVSGVWLRVVFGFLIVGLIGWLLRNCSEEFYRRRLMI